MLWHKSWLECKNNESNCERRRTLENVYEAGWQGVFMGDITIYLQEQSILVYGRTIYTFKPHKNFIIYYLSLLIDQTFIFQVNLWCIIQNYCFQRTFYYYVWLHNFWVSSFSLNENILTFWLWRWRGGRKCLCPARNSAPQRIIKRWTGNMDSMNRNIGLLSSSPFCKRNYCM